MTKDEAIKLIESCNGDVCGFSVNIISKEDIYCNCDMRTINNFDKLSDDKKEKMMSDIANELKKENFDACDAYVACLGHLKKEKYGEIEIITKNIEVSDTKITFTKEYWDKSETQVINLN